MDAKQAIIEKIISDSRSLAKSFIDEAQQKADTEIKKVHTLASDYEKKVLQKIEKEKQAIIYRKVSAAQIEAKKMLLAKKQQIIKDIFGEVYKEVTADKKEYKNFLTVLIEKYAEDKDIVTVSTDSGIIDEAAVTAISKKKKIKLSYNLDKQTFSGVILKSSNYDKKLTIN
ncbi:MAG: V-type ATP synthase subunit E family protein, partial [Clostridia bacterium]|nr:V-type ATP synthase subunit E family protein [Clostridia bacterium]